MAAVPFVNSKGERSMKRVKVERYIAGKKPAYAQEDDDDEYYTTDEEEDIDDEEAEVEDEDIQDEDDDKPDINDIKVESAELNEPSCSRVIEEDEDDDPRFRKLKLIESKPDTKCPPITRVEVKPRSVVLEEDEEDEEEIRQRHALARARALDKPIGAQAVLGQIPDQQLDVPQESREQTDDILKDLKLTGLRFKPHKKDDSSEKVEQLIEQARITGQVHRRIDEDLKQELEKEARGKGGIAANDMDAANTDDEDDEIAYEEWKLREIKRVARDRMLRERTRGLV